MARLPTWACTGCGTAFTRKSSAVRHVNKVHSGYANYVKWAEHLAGRTTGYYQPSEPPRSGTPKPTYWERKMEVMTDGFFNELGRILAGQNLTPASYKLPAFTRQSPYVGTPYMGENVFGIESYICSNCLATKPGTVCYLEGEKGGFAKYRLYCSPNAVRDINEFGLNKDEFQSMARQSCIQVLHMAVIAWMGTSSELVAVEVDDPDGYLGWITFHKMEKDKTFSVTLRYSDDTRIRIPPSTNWTWAIEAMRNGRTTLDPQQLSQFVGTTETASYGFFRLEGKPSKTFLLALTKSGSNTDLRLRKEALPVAGKQEEEKPFKATRTAKKGKAVQEG